MADLAEPTAEQWAAITAPGAAAVQAGAGCGKTTVLAGRFVHLLRPGPDGQPPVPEVGRILAITFTEKAAAEMKRRIRGLVAREVARATDAERAYWERVRRELRGADVSTIHAFCARVLRDNPIEAGIDPHAVVLDEYDSRDYRERVLAAALLDRLRGGDAAARALVARARGMRARGRGGAVRMAARLLDTLARAGRDGTWLAAATTRATEPGPLAAALAREVAGLGRAVEACLAEPRPSATVRALAEAWPAWRARLAGLGPATPPEEFLEFLGLAALLGKVRGRGLADWLKADSGRLDGRVAEAYGALAAAPEAGAAAALVADLERALADRKRADAVLTFDDLVRGAHDVLAGHPSVARRYASRYLAVLVDEFQDTDALQNGVIRLVAADPAVLFVVGDEKQSIYRFRGAEVAVFKETRDRLRATYPLGRNFRSQPGVLAFVNRMAEAMLRVPAAAAEPAQWTAFEASQRLVAHRSTSRRGPAVRLVTFAEVLARRKASAAEARELEARALAEVVADLLGRREDPVGPGAIAVLFRTLNQVKAYEYALARRGIPHYVVKGRGFFQSQEVRDLVNLLGAVAHPADGVALAAVLRSPLFGVDDETLWRLAWPDGAAGPDLAGRFRRTPDLAALGPGAAPLVRARAVLTELRRLRSRSAVAALLVRALAATDLEAVHLTQFGGRQKVANVRKVIELARDFDRRGQGGLGEFVARLRTLDADDPREAEAVLASEDDRVVRLMTIHQAKGLEFPVVVLVDLGRPLERDGDTVVVDRDHGLVAAPLVGPGGHPLRHGGLEAHRRREQERAQAEHARLFYVACTRAADELVLLEGRGKATRLTRGDGDEHVWCHRVWDVVGREAVAIAARERRVVAVDLGDGTCVQIEPADPYLAASERAMLAPGKPAEEAPAVETAVLVERILGFVPPAPREVTTTPTALAAFRRCPRQYWYRHVLGLDDAGRRGRRARLSGMLAHGILERADPGRALEPAALAALAAACPESLLLEPGDVRAVVADLAAATALLGQDAAGGFTVLAREEAVVLGVPAAAPEVVLYGRIDVLGRRDGALVVRDYKYAQATAAHVAEYADQVAAYRLAVQRHRGEPVAGEIVFVRGRAEIVSLPPLDTGRVEAALVESGRALGAVLGRRDAGAFPRRPAGPADCRALGCGFVVRCWGAPGRLSDTARDARPSTGGA